MKKLNKLDILIILLVISGVVLFAYRYMDKKNDLYTEVETDYKTAEITYLFNGIKEHCIAPLIIGDKVYDDFSKKYIGVIKDVSYKHAKNYITNSKGTLIEVENPQTFEITIVVESKLKTTGDLVLTSGGTKVAVNSNRMITTNKILITPVLKSIKYMEGEDEK